MTAPSPSFAINGGTVNVKASVTATTAVTAIIDDIQGVTQVLWEISRTDETSQPSDYTLVPSGTNGTQVDLTSLAAGTAAVIKATINAGETAAGFESATTIQEVKFFVPLAGGSEVLSGGETDSSGLNPDRTSSLTHGAVDPINVGIRNADGSSGNVTGPGTSTDRAIATYNSTTGQLLRDNPNATITAAGNIQQLANALGLLDQTARRVISRDGDDVNIGDAGHTDINLNAGTAVNVVSPLLQFPTATVAPIIAHQADAVALAGDTLSFIAQDLITITGTKVAGDFFGRGGNSTGGSSNTGGDYVSQPGAGSTANGTWRAKDGSGGDRLTINDTLTNLIGGSNIVLTAGGGSNLTFGLNTCAITAPANYTIQTSAGFLATTRSLSIFGSDNAFATGSVSAGDFNLSAGDCTGAATDNTGGSSNSQGGDASGASTNDGGPYNSRGGDATGSGTNTGGDHIGRPGSGTTIHGVWRAQDGGATDRITIDAAGNVQTTPAASVQFTSDVDRAPIVLDLFGGTRTTDAVVDSAIEFTTSTADSISFTADVSFRSGTDGDSGSTIIHGTVENTAGTAAIVGTNSIAHASAEDAGWGTVQGAPVIVDVSGALLRVRVEGVAADTVNWSVVLRVVRHQTA